MGPCVVGKETGCGADEFLDTGSLGAAGRNGGPFRGHMTGGSFVLCFRLCLAKIRGLLLGDNLSNGRQFWRPWGTGYGVSGSAWAWPFLNGQLAFTTWPQFGLGFECSRRLHSR